MKRILLLVITLVMLLALGCGANEQADAYEYYNPEIVEGLKFNKAVYKEDSLTIYHGGTLDKSCKLTYIGTDQEAIEGDIDWKVNGRTLTFKGEDADKITSLYIEQNGSKIYKIRWLNSDQYAVLAYNDCTDAGWVKFGGDENDYYTKEELEEQQRRQDDCKEEQDTNWGLLEGEYFSASGEYSVSFYTDELGIRNFNNGDYSLSVMRISIEEGLVQVVCDAGDMQCSTWFDISEDYKTIKYGPDVGELVKRE